MSPSHPISMHILYVHSRGVAAIASKCYNRTHSTICIRLKMAANSLSPSHWKGESYRVKSGLAFMTDSTKIMCQKWLSANLWRNLIRTLRLLLRSLSSLGNKSQHYRSRSRWRDHSGQQAELSIWLTTSILSWHECPPSVGAGGLSEEAILEVDAPVTDAWVRAKLPSCSLPGTLTHKVKRLTALHSGIVSSTAIDNRNRGARNDCHILSHCCFSECS